MSSSDEKASNKPDPEAIIKKDRKTSRGWEFMFFFTEAGMIALYVLFSSYADGQAISSATNETPSCCFLKSSAGRKSGATPSASQPKLPSTSPMTRK